MKRSTRALWRSARTLDDLGALYARWLIRDIDSQPCWEDGGGPDEETEPLIPTLVALNYAGLVTIDSQPGARGDWGVQRAAVNGWADVATVAGLADALARTRFQVQAVTFIDPPIDPFEVWCSPGVPVTFGPDDKPAVWYGAQLARADLKNLYGTTITSAMRDVIASSWNVTVYDPWLGVHDGLWAALDRAAEKLTK